MEKEIKIIQILDFDGDLLGLGDDGIVYELGYSPSQTMFNKKWFPSIDTIFKKENSSKLKIMTQCLTKK